MRPRRKCGNAPLDGSGDAASGASTFVAQRRSGSNPFEWKSISGDYVFGDKRIVLFAVLGAFTPACSKECGLRMIDRTSRCIAG